MSVEEKINEFIKKNKRKNVEKTINNSMTGTTHIPIGYTEDMFKELNNAGFKISPTNLMNSKLQELELSQGGSTIKEILKNLTHMTDSENLVRYEAMKNMQNPLLFGKLKWVMLLLLFFSMISLFLIFI
ncbi:MAG: hypothetical protein ACTSRG_16090 [Candidatus Helarchaeota archaeon]